eukprot:g1969.t1
MQSFGARLGGAYVNFNKGFAVMSAPTSRDLFIVGDFLVIDPFSMPRFDEEMTLKEDYDFTAQHLSTYGVVMRSNRVFVKARHYKNAGGAVAVRNDETEQRNISILKRKWPGVFRDHKRRGANEVRMDWRSRYMVDAASGKMSQRVRLPRSERLEMITILSTLYSSSKQRCERLAPLALNQIVMLVETILAHDSSTYRDVNTLERRIDVAEKILKTFIDTAPVRLESKTCLPTYVSVLSNESATVHKSSSSGESPSARGDSATNICRVSAPMLTSKVKRKKQVKNISRKKPRRSITKRRVMAPSSFIAKLIDLDAALAFDQEYMKGGRSRERYEKYKRATTTGEALRLGATKGDLKWDLSKGIGRLTDAKQHEELVSVLEEKLRAISGVEVERSIVTASMRDGVSRKRRRRRRELENVYTCTCHSGTIPPRKTARKTMVRLAKTEIAVMAENLPRSLLREADTLSAVSKNAPGKESQRRFAFDAKIDEGHRSDTQDAAVEIRSMTLLSMIRGGSSGQTRTPSLGELRLEISSDSQPANRCIVIPTRPPLAGRELL